MVGFYDGLSHPVIGTDHFLAMVSVGVISAQIGNKAIWTVPSIFILMMIVGGFFGINVEVNFSHFTDYFSQIIELGIILSVILLGFKITIKKKISTITTIIFISFFGLCHGSAHGMEMPWASNPILFVLGFISGTAILHLFGVGIGLYALKSSISLFLLQMIGVLCMFYGGYLLISI